MDNVLYCRLNKERLGMNRCGGHYPKHDSVGCPYLKSGANVPYHKIRGD